VASYKVTGRKGESLTVHSKEQADYWTGLGYTLDEGEKPKPDKPAVKKSSAKSDKK